MIRMFCKHRNGKTAAAVVGHCAAAAVASGSASSCNMFVLDDFEDDELDGDFLSMVARKDGLGPREEPADRTLSDLKIVQDAIRPSTAPSASLSRARILAQERKKMLERRSRGNVTGHNMVRSAGAGAGAGVAGRYQQTRGAMNFSQPATLPGDDLDNDRRHEEKGNGVAFRYGYHSERGPAPQARPNSNHGSPYDPQHHNRQESSGEWELLKSEWSKRNLQDRERRRSQWYGEADEEQDQMQVDDSNLFERARSTRNTRRRYDDDEYDDEYDEDRYETKTQQRPASAPSPRTSGLNRYSGRHQKANLKDDMDDEREFSGRKNRRRRGDSLSDEKDDEVCMLLDVLAVGAEGEGSDEAKSEAAPGDRREASSADSSSQEGKNVRPGQRTNLQAFANPAGSGLTTLFPCGAGGGASCSRGEQWTTAPTARHAKRAVPHHARKP
eukprot:scaffold2710_cov204-Pinguiococcus_pyrenoidosus.AAC.5